MSEQQQQVATETSKTTPAATTEKKRRGRPKGSKTKPAATGFAELSRCPKCGSTERTKYLNKTEQEYAGIDASGNEYTHIVRRRCRCAACGQMRCDRMTENRRGRKG